MAAQRPQATLIPVARCGEFEFPAKITPHPSGPQRPGVAPVFHAAVVRHLCDASLQMSDTCSHLPDCCHTLLSNLAGFLLFVSRRLRIDLFFMNAFRHPSLVFSQEFAQQFIPSFSRD